MQPAQISLAELVKSLTGLHQTQHQALMDLRLEQEDRFRLLGQGQEEDWQVIRSLLGWEVTPDAASTISHIPLIKTTRRRLWTCLRRKRRRPVRLISLPSREAQVTAQQLPVANLLPYGDLKRCQKKVGGAGAVHRLSAA